MRVKIVSAGLFGIVLALAVGCSSGGSDTLNLTEGGSQTIVAKGGNTPHFVPKDIKVSRGTEVTLTFKNEDTVAHNFTISYLGIEANADPGRSVPVKFTAPDKGTLNFYDAKFQGVGMAGKIEVT